MPYILDNLWYLSLNSASLPREVIEPLKRVDFCDLLAWPFSLLPMWNCVTYFISSKGQTARLTGGTVTLPPKNFSPHTVDYDQRSIKVLKFNCKLEMCKAENINSTYVKSDSQPAWAWPITRNPFAFGQPTQYDLKEPKPSGIFLGLLTTWNEIKLSQWTSKTAIGHCLSWHISCDVIFIVQRCGT